MRIWLDIGKKEGSRIKHQVRALKEILLANGWQKNLDFAYLEFPEARHEESAWAARFGEVLKFLFPYFMMDGILIIDKPAGITSHDVVARCRRILKTKRIGHTGTLDPFATGVMVILVGKATRLAQFLDKDAKEYEAIVRFGFETDTGDRTGELRITNYELRDVSIEEIENVLKDFRGEIEQTPPMYSAKKVEGKKLYELARKGIEIERKPVKVTIYELELIEIHEIRRKATRTKT